jgi:hypothetical protein
MQAITWDKEEFQASVQKKLAVLRANRQADKGLTLDQRLVLVDDRLAFSEALKAADNRRALQLQQENARAPRQIFVQAMSGQDKSMASKLFGGHFFARVDDVGHANGAGHDGDSSAARGSKPAQHTLTEKRYQARSGRTGRQPCDRYQAQPPGRQTIRAACRAIQSGAEKRGGQKSPAHN